MHTYKKQLFAVALAALASACSGTSEEPAGPAGQGVAVQVTPPAPTVRTGGTVGFTASVTGTMNTSVTWTVVQAGGGTIDATGRYTAPGTTGTYTVRATSVADPLATGEAAVTVQAPVAVTISPRTPSVVAGGTIAFTATVANSTNAAVTWSVPGTGCGTITQAGVYSAPATARTCSVVSTSQADPTKSDTATVTVTAAPLPVAVTISPRTPSVVAGGTIAFTATVANSTNAAVTWSVPGTGCGTITQAGVYSAPATARTCSVVSTSQADPTKSDTATVTVTAAPLPVAVTISPRTPSVVAGGTIAFTATVANSTNAAVTWSVPGTGCGTITQAGVYSAPATARTCSVVSTSQADPTKSDTATVTVTAAPLPVAIAVTPSPAAVDACKTLTFTATVTNTTNRAATWTIQEGAAGGTITSGGVYTAPASAGTYHVVGTSVADPTKSAIATVTVTERVLSVAVNPPTASVQTGGAVQFTATVTTTCGAFVSAATVP